MVKYTVYTGAKQIQSGSWNTDNQPLFYIMYSHRITNSTDWCWLLGVF